MWDIQDNYKANFEKIKVLDINLKPGQIVYIPAYWWYTVRFTKFSSVCKFSYRTFIFFVYFARFSFETITTAKC